MPQHDAVLWLSEYGQRYPGCWQEFAGLLEKGQRDKSNKWSSWCWMPLQGAHAVLSILESKQLIKTGATADEGFRKAQDHLRDLSPKQDTGALGALAAWRATQGIYRIEGTLLEEIYSTRVTGNIPTEVLQRLPEWCVYVELLPGMAEIGGHEVAGFFAFLDEHLDTKEVAIRFQISCRSASSSLLPVHIPLKGTVEESFAKAAFNVEVVTFAQLMKLGPSAEATRKVRELQGSNRVLQEREMLEGFLSIVLYLCADETDVPRPARPESRILRTKKGHLTLPAPQKHTIHPCGTRLGAELRWAREQAARQEAAEPTGRTVAPHVRRAHWHTFLSGPRDGARVSRVKWLPPIRVKIEDVPTIATVHPVGKP